MPFADVKHQDAAIERLQRGLAGERLAHALLFEGPEGVGKQMVAQRLAAALLCGHSVQSKGPGGAKWIDACGRCDDCLLFAAGTHPDFHRIYRALNKHHPDKQIQRRKATVLMVDVIRHFLIDKIGHSPARGRAKVFVVMEAERMNDEAQNALLKTLEEPPGRSYLLLLTNSASLLLPTTRSRCQTISLRPLPTDFVVDMLTKRHGADPAAARFLAELAQGRLGLAIRYLKAGLYERLGDVLAAVRLATDDALAGGRALLELSKEVAKAEESSEADEADAAAVVESSEGEEEEPAADVAKGDINVAREAQTTVLAMVAIVLRDVLRVTAGAAPAAVADARTIQALATRTEQGGVAGAIRAMAEATQQVERFVNTGLIFDGVGIAVARGLAPGVLA